MAGALAIRPQRYRDPMIVTSIVHHPVWVMIEPYLHLVEHGDPLDPQVRIEFLDVPEQLARTLVMAEMPCVACQRPIHPLRRREGDFWDRLYYGPTCELHVRKGCSRSRSAMLEYERFLGLKVTPRPTPQLSLAL